jgi:hypothetical protein
LIWPPPEPLLEVVDDVELALPAEEDPPLDPPEPAPAV